MKAVIFPGSFDPPTNGHLNLIMRATRVFDHVIVLVALNEKKEALFTLEERVDLLKKILGSELSPSLEVDSCRGFLVDYAAKRGIFTFLRGLRSNTDLDWEIQLHHANQTLDARIETVLLPTDPSLAVLRSSFVRMLISHGRDVRAYVSPAVESALRLRLGLDKG